MTDISIFEAIRSNDTELVKKLIADEPTLVNTVSPRKPPDIKGMSPLQVALCTGWHAQISWFLLESGADVNYIPDRKWTDEAHPVLFDAADVAIWNARRLAWDGKNTTPLNLEWKHTAEKADEAFRLLEQVLKRGADVTKTDYYGRNVLMEAVSEASKLCPVRNNETGEYYPGRPITPEMQHDMRRIFKLLINAGADRNNVSAYSKKSIREHYENESVWEICGDLWDASD